MSENKKSGKRMFKKIKHKKPVQQQAKLPPAKAEPEFKETDIETLLAEETPAPQPAPAPAGQEEDEFERLLNEFISAELDDVEEEIENIKNGEEPAPQITLPRTNSNEQNAAQLQEEEQALYRAYQNYFFAIKSIAEAHNLKSPSPTVEAENLFPRYKPKIGKKISEDILKGWDVMLSAFSAELAGINPAGTDDELLDFAEKATDDNLQLALISYVEILIETEGCEISYTERKLKAERRKLERQLYEEHQKRIERVNKYIEAIQAKKLPINAERLVKNFFKTSNKDAEGAYQMLTNNPAPRAPIEINILKPRFFGLIKVTPQDGIRANKEIGEFIKKLKF